MLSEYLCVIRGNGDSRVGVHVLNFEDDQFSGWGFYTKTQLYRKAQLCENWYDTIEYVEKMETAYYNAVACMLFNSKPYMTMGNCTSTA
jgi:hypothetical protein